MSILRWDAFAELERIRAKTDKLWNDFLYKFSEESEGSQAVGFLPEVDLVETAYDYRIFIAVPGLIEDDIDIEATANSIIVRGERHPPYDPRRHHVREWRYGFFERKLVVNAPILVDRVQACYEAGVLSVVLPKQQPDITDEG